MFSGDLSSSRYKKMVQNSLHNCERIFERENFKKMDPFDMRLQLNIIDDYEMTKIWGWDKYTQNTAGLVDFSNREIYGSF